jgi:hypothetical protein
MQPAVLGGLFIGILSALPIVSVGNCCCLWIIGGGFLAAYLDSQNRPDNLPVSRGVLDGFLAAVVGAFVWLLVSVALAGLLAPLQERMAEEIGRRAATMPPETRAWFDAVAARGTSSLRYFIGFCFQLVIGMIFAPVGGALAAVFFKKDVPPALGGPPPLP